MAITATLLRYSARTTHATDCNFDQRACALLAKLRQHRSTRKSIRVHLESQSSGVPELDSHQHTHSAPATTHMRLLLFALRSFVLLMMISRFSFLLFISFPLLLFLVCFYGFIKSLVIHNHHHPLSLSRSHAGTHVQTHTRTRTHTPTGLQNHAHEHKLTSRYTCSTQTQVQSHATSLLALLASLKSALSWPSVCFLFRRFCVPRTATSALPSSPDAPTRAPHHFHFLESSPLLNAHTALVAHLFRRTTTKKKK